MVPKSRTVAQQMLRLSAVTWLTVKGVHNITTCASVFILLLLSTPVAVNTLRFTLASTTSLAPPVAWGTFTTHASSQHFDYFLVIPG
jgi:hypothetical protein